MPPWNKIDTVMFDMDGTLLDLHFDNYFWQTLVPQVYSKANGVSEAAALDFLMRKYTEVYGTLKWYCLDYWADQLQLDVAALKETAKHKITLRPNVKTFIHPKLNIHTFSEIFRNHNWSWSCWSWDWS